MTPTDIGAPPEWLVNLGGWGVVLLIVRWMMNRIDALTSAYVETMKAAISEFKEFRLQEARQHEALEEALEDTQSLIRHLDR